MYLHKLHLTNFKNYADANIEFASKINVLVGTNGSGKTNLLDAIYYLSFTKSAFQNSDPLNIRHGADHFFIRGNFDLEGRENEVVSGFQSGAKKVFKENGAEYQRLSDHIGKYPVVLVTPDDTELIRGGSEVRRKFFDSIISQIDRAYLEQLIGYNQVLRQRNGLLKMFHDSRRVDWTALDMYDHALVKFGEPIHEKRKSFAIEFMREFNKFYSFLVSDKEQADLAYDSGVGETEFLNGLLTNRQKDLVLQRTNFGIHRDDYEFRLGPADMKRFGSQGQQKSFVIALKLTQWEIIKSIKGFKPVLMLDDIFDKLDDLRITQLLRLIKEDFGQLFITDARPDRTQRLLNETSVEDRLVFEVVNGEATRI